MLKYFIFLSFFISINCLANLPVNCSNINESSPKVITNILNYMCNHNNLNKINYITKNTTIFNNWITNGYFFIIDKTENVLLIPYETFKQLLFSSNSWINSANLVEDSSVVSVLESKITPKIANASCLVKTPINSINEFIDCNDHYLVFDIKAFFIAAIIVSFSIIGFCFLLYCTNNCREKAQYRSRLKNNNDIENNYLSMKECTDL